MIKSKYNEVDYIMAIKLIVMDMDGTLLNQDDQISEKTKKALMECQKKGIRLILASGRSRFRLFQYAKELEMEKYGGKLIEVNGMAYYDLQTRQREVIKRLKSDEIIELFKILKQTKAEIQGYLDNAVYDYIPEAIFEIKKQVKKEKQLPEDYPWTGGAWEWLTDMRNGYPSVYYFCAENMLPKELNKFIVIDEEAKNEVNYQQLKAVLGERFEMVRTCPRLIEINPKGITKGQTLKKIMANEQIAYDEVLAFGDGENDVDMFSVVKYGIAMGNAKEYVKNKAFDVTLSNREDGIAVAIEKYCKS